MYISGQERCGPDSVEQLCCARVCEEEESVVHAGAPQKGLRDFC